MRLYHFTAYYHLPAIIAAGTLRTTESNLSIQRPHAGPDCVWFLDGPDLGSADHGLGDGESVSPLDKSAVRIVCDVPDYKVVRWAAWARQKADALTVASMVDTGGGEAAAERWLVTLARFARIGGRQSKTPGPAIPCGSPANRSAWPSSGLDRGSRQSVSGSRASGFQSVSTAKGAPTP
jgi:hypothetical protein